MGTVVVDNPSVTIASPADVQAQGKKEMDALMALVPEVTKAAMTDIKPAERNADGTMTHYIAMGYSQGQIDLEFYFPNKLTVHPGDTVVWILPKADVAPHTVTLSNG